MSGYRTILTGVAALAWLAPALSAPAVAQPLGPEPWVRMPVQPGGNRPARPSPPREGRKRCISVTGMAGAQLFGDRGMEMAMGNGQRYRLYFANECPALSFYQGFYYKRRKAGQLCAGRDIIAARSGEECPIASIMPVPSDPRTRTAGRRR